MATNFEWGIKTMDRILASGAVKTIHYTVTAADSTYSAGAYGTVGLDQPEDEADLIPYADLTHAWAVDAVQAKLGGQEKVELIESKLQQQIDEQYAPTEGSGTPW